MRLIPIIIIFLSGLTGLQASDKQQTIEKEMLVDVSQYKGKILYLDFWASWCIPCRKSFPWLNKMREKYHPDQLAIVAVNLDKERELAAKFLENYPANFQIVYDPEGKVEKYQIPGMPSSILFNINGEVIEAHSGFYKKKISEYESLLDVAVNGQ